MEEESEPIVIDMGSGTLKAGFASDDAPKCIIPMIIGKPRDPGILVGMDQKDCYVGYEAKAKKNLLIIEEPIMGGIVQNIDHIKKIFDHLMNNELRVSPEEHKIMLTEPPNNPKKNREELVELMFTEFKCPKLYLGNQSVLSLFATGRTTGTVLDSGEGITHTVPIYEGYAIPHAIEEIPLSGRDLTMHLYEMLLKRESNLTGTTTGDLEIVKRIKEEKCIVA